MSVLLLDYLHEHSQMWDFQLLCYVLIIVSGQAGKGCVYTYDAVGSYERSGYSSQGSGQTLIMPVLDNQLKSASPLVLPPRVSVIFRFV